MMESIEDGLWRDFQELLRKVEKLERDQWIELPVRTRLSSFCQSLMSAWCSFERSRQDKYNTDNGPTRADIAGEVRHDIG
jgi:hypothetical protein